MDDVNELVDILAAWANAPGVTVYLFGSRVRGDHRPDSDVDIHVHWNEGINDNTARWWEDTNVRDFADLKQRLPGPLQICEGPAKLLAEVRAARVVVRRANVTAVWTERRKIDEWISAHSD